MRSSLLAVSAAVAVAAGGAAHAAPAVKYANVVVVAKSGGDFTDPVAAAASITDASAAKPYLLQIMPGVYQLTDSVTLPPYVELEGSGEVATKLVASPTIGPGITCVSNTAVRQLTVEAANTTAIGVYGGIGVKIQDVTASGFLQGLAVSNSLNVTLDSVRASEASTGADHSAVAIANSRGVYLHDVAASAGGPDSGGTSNAISVFSSEVVMDGVSAVASGGGSSVYALNATAGTSARLTNCYFEATGAYGSYGISNWSGDQYSMQLSGVTVIGGTAIRNGSQMFIENSQVYGTPIAIDSGATTVRMVNTKIGGTLGANPAMKCIGVYSEAYDPITCQ